MNRPKRPKSRRPVLWTSPLVSMADAEARRHEERINAQIRPFIITMGLKGVAIILFLGVILWGEKAIAAGAPTPPDRDSIGFVLMILARALAPAIATIAFVEILFRGRLRRRWVYMPKVCLEHARAGGLVTLLVMAAVFATVTAFLIALLPALAFVAGFMILTLAALYLIISGIRRRVGWDPSCAKCGYPHPDDTLTTCPECGRPTPPRSHTAIILGHNTISYPRIAIGLILLVVAAALITLQ